MRHVEPGPAPTSLSSARAQAERAALAQFYADAANARAKYPKGFSAYQGEGVREALTRAFHGKCAYCETYYAATQPADIEHFRPKGAVADRQGTLQPPGYWWLASDWSNLLPSCSDCNRPRRQDFPAGLPRTAGKANKFPLGSERTRAVAAGQESRERRLLLNPYLDDPARYLRFVSGTGTIRDGEVAARKTSAGRPAPRGQASIEVYALNRLGLLEKRRAVLRKLEAHLARALELKAAALRHPEDADLVAAFRAAVADIALYTQPDQEYSAMCTQVAADFRATLFGQDTP
ncbi:MAG TPA: hypothetical protein VFL46_02060 [Phycicoccus sp.]|nr:hypothetical protein [Phycicoccus sp.]